MLGETSQHSLLPVAHSLRSGQPAQSRSHPAGPQAQARVYMQASGLPQPKLPLPTLITVFCQSFVLGGRVVNGPTDSSLGSLLGTLMPPHLAPACDLGRLQSCLGDLLDAFPFPHCIQQSINTTLL